MHKLARAAITRRRRPSCGGASCAVCAVVQTITADVVAKVPAGSSMLVADFVDAARPLVRRALEQLSPAMQRAIAAHVEPAPRRRLP